MWAMEISTVRQPSSFCGYANGAAIILFNDRQRKIADGVVHRMVKRAVEMEGTVTGEHGVGLVKRDYLDHELGQSTVDAMRRVSHDSLSSFRTAHESDCPTSSNKPSILSVS